MFIGNTRWLLNLVISLIIFLKLKHVNLPPRGIPDLRRQPLRNQTTPELDNKYYSAIGLYNEYQGVCSLQTGNHPRDKICGSVNSFIYFVICLRQTILH